MFDVCANVDPLFVRCPGLPRQGVAGHAVAHEEARSPTAIFRLFNRNRYLLDNFRAVRYWLQLVANVSKPRTSLVGIFQRNAGSGQVDYPKTIRSAVGSIRDQKNDDGLRGKPPEMERI